MSSITDIRFHNDLDKAFEHFEADELGECIALCRGILDD